MGANWTLLTFKIVTKLLRDVLHSRACSRVVTFQDKNLIKNDKNFYPHFSLNAFHFNSISFAMNIILFNLWIVGKFNFYKNLNKKLIFFVKSSLIRYNESQHSGYISVMILRFHFSAQVNVNKKIFVLQSAR